MADSKTKKSRLFNEQKKCKDFIRGYGHKCKFGRPWGSLFECEKIEPLICPYAMYMTEEN